MRFILMLTDAQSALGRLLDRCRSLLLLGARLWVAWLFTATSAHPAGVAPLTAMAERPAQLFLALLLSLGLFARIGALGALGLNAALLSFPSSSLAAASTHERYLLSLFMLLVLTLFGPGRIAVDAWLERRSAARCRPATAALAR